MGSSQKFRADCQILLCGMSEKELEQVSQAAVHNLGGKKRNAEESKMKGGLDDEILQHVLEFLFSFKTLNWGDTRPCLACRQAWKPENC
jgi:hypothetical protein